MTDSCSLKFRYMPLDRVAGMGDVWATERVGDDDNALRVLMQRLPECGELNFQASLACGSRSILVRYGNSAEEALKELEDDAVSLAYNLRMLL
jgi:hypothetical protein